MRKKCRVIPKTCLIMAIGLIATMLFSTIIGPVGAGVNYAPPEAIGGYVRDANGNPVSGARVIDLTGGGSDTTDSYGRYGFGVTAGGTHQVKASKTGYADQTISVFISTKTGVGTGNFNLVPLHSNNAEFSKSSYPDDQYIAINYAHANDGGTLSITLYRPDGTNAQTYANLPIGSGTCYHQTCGEQPGIWSFIATSSIYGSWQRTTTVGFMVLDFSDDYGASFDNLLIGMATKTAIGSDTHGITTSVGASIYSYVNAGGQNGEYNRSIYLGVSTRYHDNDVRFGYDSIRSVTVIVKKVIWDPDGDGGQPAYGSPYSIDNSYVEFRNGGSAMAGSDVLQYSDGSTVGVLGDVCVSAVTAAMAPAAVLALELAYIMSMTAMSSRTAPNFISDFGDSRVGAGVDWSSGVYLCPDSTTYNYVQISLNEDFDSRYAFEISAIFFGVSNNINYEIISSPIYLCVGT